MWKKSARQKINIESLKASTKHDLFQQCLTKKLMNTKTKMESPEDRWKALRLVIHALCEGTLGFSTRNHQDWFDETDQFLDFLIIKCRAFCAWLNGINSKRNRMFTINLKLKFNGKLTK